MPVLSERGVVRDSGKTTLLLSSKVSLFMSASDVLPPLAELQLGQSHKCLQFPLMHEWFLLEVVPSVSVWVEIQ